MQYILKITTILLFVSGCQGKIDSPNTISQSKENKEEVNISEAEANNIFKYTTEKNPTYLKVFGEKKLMVGIVPTLKNNDDAFKLITLRHFADKWYELHHLNYGFDAHFNLIDTFETVKIDSIDYVYFSAWRIDDGTGAAGIGSIEFNLFDFQKNKMNQIICSGRYDKNDIIINGDYYGIDTISNQGVVDFFEEKAMACKQIYKPSKEDLDLDNFKNWERKWKIENSNLPNIYSDNPWGEGTLKIKYYDQPLFPVSDNFSEKIENDRYVVVAYFRNNVLGYDKVKKKYFPIWIESCNHFCHKNIKFDDENTLRLTGEFSKKAGILIDLNTHNFKIVSTQKSALQKIFGEWY